MSSDTATRTALVGVSIASTEFIPFHTQQLDVLASNALQFTHFLPTVAKIFRVSHVWVKPVFGAELFSVYVHVTRFFAIVGVKIRPLSSS